MRLGKFPDKLSRRTYLALAGTGAVVGLAGCTAEAEPSDTETPGDDSPSELHPTYGFVGESMDAAAPAEHDHEVQLLIGPREGAEIPTFYFEPTGLFVESGDVVKFVFATPDHGVTAYHSALGRTSRVPERAPPLSSPTMPGGTYWLYRFDAPGVYDLYCPPHEAFGMAMRVVVDEATGPGAEPVSTEPPAHGDPRPPMQTSATVLSDPALAPENVVEQETVSWDDLDPESKALQG